MNPIIVRGNKIMELTIDILNKDRLEMEESISNTYGKYSKEYNDMMFAINLYYQGLKFILEK